MKRRAISGSAAEFKLPHAEIARMVGRNRSTVANLLRLLQLPAEVQAMVHQKSLSEGHARALLALDDQERIIALASDAVDQGWSVREMEARVRGDEPRRWRTTRAGRHGAADRVPQAVSADARRVEDALRKQLRHRRAA